MSLPLHSPCFPVLVMEDDFETTLHHGPPRYCDQVGMEVRAGSDWDSVSQVHSNASQPSRDARRRDTSSSSFVDLIEDFTMTETQIEHNLSVLS